jgi:hypothetical protein
MGNLKLYYSEGIRQQSQQKNLSPSSCDNKQLFGQVFLAVRSSEITANGFRAVRITPLGRNVFVMLILLQTGRRQQKWAFFTYEVDNQGQHSNL